MCRAPWPRQGQAQPAGEAAGCTSLQGGWRRGVMHPHPSAFEVISPCTCWFPFPHHCSPEQCTNTSGGPLLPGLCCWWEPLPAAGVGAVFQQCFGIINIPSLGHRDVPNPEPLMPAKDSWAKAGQKEQAAPILDPPAAHFSPCKPPMGLQSRHSSSYMPQGAATAHIPACTGRGGSTASSETLSHPSQAAVKAQKGSHRCNFLPMPITGSAPSVPPPVLAVISSP